VKHLGLILFLALLTIISIVLVDWSRWFTLDESKEISISPTITPKQQIQATQASTLNYCVYSEQLPVVPSSPSLIKSDTETYLGHYSYLEANPNGMIVVGSYGQNEYQGFERLNKEATLALMQMMYAARDDHVWLIVVSGFRTVTCQNQLFERQIERQGSPQAAAKISAPPGYSEHHTGYAVDLADGHTVEKNDLDLKFLDTEAFHWLKQHAQEFGFELSFPENNAQGVSFEPWHWRYIGSEKALEIFAAARAK
jgi:D-alanyl-D-alanine carboxypeptidase